MHLFQEDTTIEMDEGYRLQTQACERIWASVAQVLKATAKERGWQYGDNFLLSQVAEQLGEETGQQTKFCIHMVMAEAMYRGIYEDWDNWEKIKRHHQDAEEFVCLIDQARVDGPHCYRISDEDGQFRISRSLGLPMPSHAERSKAMLDRLLPVGTYSKVGFSPGYGYKFSRGGRG